MSGLNAKYMFFGGFFFLFFFKAYKINNEIKMKAFVKWWINETNL